MKIEKTASGSRKVTMSKEEWLHIGKQAGWKEQEPPSIWKRNKDKPGWDKPWQKHEGWPDVEKELLRLMRTMRPENFAKLIALATYGNIIKEIQTLRHPDPNGLYVDVSMF